MLKLGPALCRITRFWFRVGRLVLGPAPAEMLSSMLLLHAARLCVARRLLPKKFTLPFTVSSRTTFPPWVLRWLWNRYFCGQRHPSGAGVEHRWEPASGASLFCTTLRFKLSPNSRLHSLTAVRVPWPAAWCTLTSVIVSHLILRRAPAQGRKRYQTDKGRTSQLKHVRSSQASPAACLVHQPTANRPNAHSGTTFAVRYFATPG